MADIITEYQEANDYLNKKGIKTALAHLIGLNDTSPNTYYVALPKARLYNEPTPEQLAQVRQAKQMIAEIPFAGDCNFRRVIIEAANKAKERLGNVTLSDPVYILTADKDEIRKMVTRLKRSNSNDELTARKAELQSLIDSYEEKENDTDRDDLIDKFQNIREYLEQGQQALENNDKQSCVSSLEEALYQ